MSDLVNMTFVCNSNSWFSMAFRTVSYTHLVNRGIGDNDSFGFRRIRRPGLIKIQIIAKVLGKHRAVQGTDNLNIQPRRLFQQILNLYACLLYTSGTPKSIFPPVRSTIEPIPTTSPPAALTSSRTSRTDPPVVTTSSTRSTFCPG